MTITQTPSRPQRSFLDYRQLVTPKSRSALPLVDHTPDLAFTDRFAPSLTHHHCLYPPHTYTPVSSVIDMHVAREKTFATEQRSFFAAFVNSLLQCVHRVSSQSTTPTEAMQLVNGCCEAYLEALDGKFEAHCNKLQTELREQCSRASTHADAVAVKRMLADACHEAETESRNPYTNWLLNQQQMNEDAVIVVHSALHQLRNIATQVSQELIRCQLFSVKAQNANTTAQPSPQEVFHDTSDCELTFL